ncbi:unnamed protein product [Brassica rapa subsp. narinosa]
MSFIIHVSKNLIRVSPINDVLMFYIDDLLSYKEISLKLASVSLFNETNNTQ